MDLLPSGLKDTHHKQGVGSLYPRRMISPLYVTSHPVLWKNSSQPASARSDAASKLLDIPGDR